MAKKAKLTATFILAALVMTGMTAVEGCPTSGGGGAIPDKSGGGRSGGYLRLNSEPETLPWPASKIALDDEGEGEI